MKQVVKMPLDGQFVAVYRANNAIWSDTLLWCEDRILKYVEEDDDFEIVEYDIVEHLTEHKAIFFTL